MGTNDQDNETQPQPVDPSREVSLTNDSLMNGEADDQGQTGPARIASTSPREDTGPSGAWLEGRSGWSSSRNRTTGKR